jgi:hypothetical protein
MLLAERVQEVNAYEYGLASPASSIGPSSSKGVNSTRIPEPAEDRHALILELAGTRARWPPVRMFAELGGITLLLRGIGMAFEWNFQGRTECMKNALEVLAVCAISPVAQVSNTQLFDCCQTCK